MGTPRFVDDHLGYLLGQANHALYKDFDAHVRAAGLSSIEWRVLAALHDSPPLTVSQLAQEALSKQPTVTKLVQRMAEQGWLVLQADATDQRRTLVSASASGRRLVKPLVDAGPPARGPHVARAGSHRKAGAEEDAGKADAARLSGHARRADGRMLPARSNHTRRRVR